MPSFDKNVGMRLAFGASNGYYYKRRDGKD